MQNHMQSFYQSHRSYKLQGRVWGNDSTLYFLLLHLLEAKHFLTLKNFKYLDVYK